MKKLKGEELQIFQGGSGIVKFKPNWMDCTFMTAGAIVTTIYVPFLGAVMGGVAANCWSKT